MARKKKVTEDPTVPTINGFHRYCRERNVSMDFGFDKIRGKIYSQYVASLPKKI